MQSSFGKGNLDLPIAQFKEEILDAVAENDCVIITTETGAGKSTQVPQYLLEAGYRVVVTEPRRLAARTVAERVAEEYGCSFGGLVGYRTADPKDRRDSADTKCLFCTDGLQLVRELTGAGADVLVLDEVHEWNINIETLVAWAKKRLADGDANFKVVIMSATLEAEKLAKFFGDAPVISVPDRLFPVQTKESYSEISVQARKLAEAGKNVLVFQPGKSEIAQTISDLEGIEAEVLPLHGELTPAEQKKCFQHYDVPKVVVSTNVAQTSVTVDDINVVVDSGTERRIELVDGIEGLYLKSISKADSKQRAGRAGRTSDGEYYFCNSRYSLDELPAFGKAEIERSRLDQLVLRLAVSGFDATELEFFHQPDREVLVNAKKALTSLGALDQDGNVTEIGKLMSRLPVDVHIARMIVEASERGVVSDVIDIAACVEAGGIKDRSGKALAMAENRDSDLLAELEIFQKASTMKKDELRDAGIFMKSYFKAREIRSRLRDALRRYVQIESTGDKEQILRSCVAGMVDHLFHNDYGDYRNGGHGSSRQIDKNSVVSSGEWVTGMPWDLEIKTRRGGRMTLNLITWVSKVDPEWLVEVAPQLSTSFLRNYRWNGGKVVADEVKTFNGSEIGEEIVAVEGESQDAVQAFAIALPGSQIELPCMEHNRAVQSEIASLIVRGAKISSLSNSQLTEFYIRKLGSVYQKTEAEKINLNLSDSDVSEILGIDYPAIRAEITVGCPDVVRIEDEECIVTYERDYSESKIRIHISREILANMSQDQVTGLLLVDYKIQLEDKDYTDLADSEVQSLREKAEVRRLDLQWKEFKSENAEESAEIKGLEPLPELAEPKVWGQDAGGNDLFAYQALRTSWGSWYLTWYRSQEEANQAQATAIEKKAKLDKETQEKIEFDSLVVEAQALHGQVEILWSRVDQEQYKSYGLSNDDVRESWSSDRSVVDKLAKAKKLAFGDSYNRQDPKQALELLGELKAKIEKAIEYRQENEGRRDEAKVAFEDLKKTKDEVYELYNQNLVEYEIHDNLRDSLSEAASAYEDCNFLKVIEIASQAQVQVADAKSKAEKERQFQTLRNDFIKDEYGTCPVCSDEIETGSTHYCRENALSIWADGVDEVILKSSEVGESLFISLKADYDESYSEWNFRLEIEQDVRFESRNEIATKIFYAAPTEEDIADFAEETRQKQAYERYEEDFQYAEEEVSSGNWLKLSFRQSKHPKTGKVQYEASQGKGLKYVLDSWSSYEPVEGEVYFCSMGRILVDTASFRLQIVELEAPFPEDDPYAETPVVVVEEEAEESPEKVSQEQLDALLQRFGKK